MLSIEKLTISCYVPTVMSIRQVGAIAFAAFLISSLAPKILEAATPSRESSGSYVGWTSGDPVAQRAASSRAHLELLERRLEILLQDMLGPDRARIFIQSSPARRPALPDKDKLLWDTMVRRVDTLPQVLPGYSVPRNLVEEALRSWNIQGSETKLSATLLVDPQVGAGQTQEAVHIIAKMLKLPVQDIQVVTTPILTKTGPSPIEKLTVEIVRTTTSISLLLTLLIAALLFLAYRAHRDRAPNPPPLGFWARPHAGILAEFLKQASPQTAAWVLRSLKGGLAAEVYQRLPEALQRESAQMLLSMSLKSANLKIQKRLKKYVQAHQSGLGLVEELLLRSPEWMRERVLSHLEAQDPESAQRLKNGLVSLSHLAQADSISLQLCLSPYSSEQLALGLYDLPKSVVESLLRGLPQTMRSLVQKNMKFLVPGSLDQVERIRGDILARWKRLEASGRVSSLSVRQVSGESNGVT